MPCSFDGSATHVPGNHDEFIPGCGRYCGQVNSITIRKAGDEIEQVPGFFEGDIVAHCGPILMGEFARSVDLTCLNIGWTYTRSIRNNAHLHIREALDRFIPRTPFEVTGVDFDNGPEFFNYDVIGWADELEIYFTRARPYKKIDQATIEPRHNQIVRSYTFYWRYGTPPQLRLLNELRPLVNDRHNYLTQRKTYRWDTDTKGRRRRVYKFATPFDRLLRSEVLSPEKTRELTAYRDNLNPPTSPMNRPHSATLHLACRRQDANTRSY